MPRRRSLSDGNRALLRRYQDCSDAESVRETEHQIQLELAEENVQRSKLQY